MGKDDLWDVRLQDDDRFRAQAAELTALRVDRDSWEQQAELRAVEASEYRQQVIDLRAENERLRKDAALALSGVRDKEE